MSAALAEVVRDSVLAEQLQPLRVAMIDVDIVGATRHAQSVLSPGIYNDICRDQGALLAMTLKEGFQGLTLRPFRVRARPAAVGADGRRLHDSSVTVMAYTRETDAAIVQALGSNVGRPKLQGALTFRGARAMPREWRPGQIIGFNLIMATTMRVGRKLPPEMADVSLLPPQFQDKVLRPGMEIDVFEWMRRRVDVGIAIGQDLTPVLGPDWERRVNTVTAQMAADPFEGMLLDDEDPDGWMGDDLAEAARGKEFRRLAAQKLLSRETVYVDLVDRRLKANVSANPFRLGHGKDDVRRAASLVRDQTRVVAMRRSACWRLDHPADGKPRRSVQIEVPMIEVQGRLKIEDGEAFMRLLETGVGSHTGFGFGMLALTREEAA